MSADEGTPPEDREATPSDTAGTRGATGETGAWRLLAHSMAPRLTRGQLVAGVLCALLGFAFVAQIRQTNSDDLSSLSQTELVRLLDETTQRGDALESQAANLRSQRSDLVTGADSSRAALEAAAHRAEVQGILAGALPAQGPGVLLTIRQTDERLSAAVLLNVLEELRNAGAEAIQLNDRRLTASSYLVDTTSGVLVDGVELEAPYTWLAIGDPGTIIPALEMPGGALATVRTAGGLATIKGKDHLIVDAIRELQPARYATPALSDTGDGN
jgi:uncharacterized protein YlxW (UPF0749 family)